VIFTYKNIMIPQATVTEKVANAIKQPGMAQ
jgi:hypothetical protein